MEILIKTIDEEFEDLKKAKINNPAALAAYIGRKKLGKEKFQELSAKGKRRKKAPKGKAKMRLGGGGRFAKLESELASKKK